MKHKQTVIRTIGLAALATLLAWQTQAASMTAFTYQGQLLQAGSPANGLYELKFELFNYAQFDDPDGENRIPGVSVTNGIFTVQLDFGDVFNFGSARWLQISVRTNGSVAPFTVLTPRQQLAATPFALSVYHAITANIATTASNVTALSVTGAGIANSTITAGKIASGAVVKSVNTLKDDVNLAPGANVTITPSGQTLTLASPSDWHLTGNSGTTPGTHFLGTTDGQPFDLRVSNSRGLRLDYESALRGGKYIHSSVNLLGGFSGNTISNGAVGCTIAGGGYNWRNTLSGASADSPNVVSDDFGTVGGGYNNTAGYGGTVPGGYDNSAIGVGSFAAGVDAHATNDASFVWNDGQQTATSSGNNRFEVYAAGGINFRTSGTLDVQNSTNATGTIHVGSTTSGPDPKLIKFGDGDYVHIGENGADDRMELKAGTFFFTTGLGSGNVGIGTPTPEQKLDVNGQFLLVRGAGNERAYLGGDGSGSDVQVGSLNTNVVNVAMYNGGNGTYMNLYVKTLTITGGADLAEPFEMSAKDIPEGAVVIIDEEHPGHLKLSERAYDTRVAGIVSGAQGVSPGIQMKQHGLLGNGQNVALSGRVYVQADASLGSIKPGDLLTTSTVPGYAMKVTDNAKAQGAILGKAMSSLVSGKGLVLVLVSLQ